jgi:uridine phosphorylase
VDVQPILRELFQRSDLPRTALLPGDPGRVDLICRNWTDTEEVHAVRGYRAALGRLTSVPIAAISTGIGGPSSELVVAEAAALGFTSLIRVGTSGSLHERVRPGDLVINEASVRLDGTSELYARATYPAAADHRVTAALCDAAAALGCTYHVGVGCTSASFFAGQERATPQGYLPPAAHGLMEEMRALSVLNFEEEAATLFVLGRLLGVQTGAVLAIIGNRVSGDYPDPTEAVRRAVDVANRAAVLLHARTAVEAPKRAGETAT